MNYPTVLFVDDEEKILSALRCLFRPEPYRFLQALGAAEALALLEAGEKPAVIVSDQRMPGMDGAAFLERCRQITPKSVRLILTDYADVQTAIAAVNRGGVYRYLLKPWKDEDLLLSIKEAHGHFSLIEENRRLIGQLQEKNTAIEYFTTRLEAKVEERTRAFKDEHRKNVELNRQLQRKVKELEGRDHIQQHLLSIHTAEETLNTVARAVAAVFDAATVIVHLKDPTLRPAAVFEGNQALGEGQLGNWDRRPPFTQAVQRVCAHNQSVHVSGPRLILEGETFSVPPFAIAPIAADDQILGALEVHFGAPLDTEGLQALGGFALQAAVAINDSRLQMSIPEWQGDLDDILDQLY